MAAFESKHLDKARAFLECYKYYINPGMMEYMAEQLALLLVRENTSDEKKPK